MKQASQANFTSACRDLDLDLNRISAAWVNLDQLHQEPHRAQGRIYQTQYFEHLETQAHNNSARELEVLIP